MPRQIRFYETGGPEVLKFEDVTLQHPQEGEVIVRVEAIGLNRAESMFMHGQFFERPQLPARLGYEASGVVKEVGTGVDLSWIGKRISVIPSFSMNEYGTLGEEIVVPVYALQEYPAQLSALEAAAVWMQYLTAYGAIVELGQIAIGDFVLITAASSSVGIAAIETVKAKGGVSIALVRASEKRARLLELGADHVIVSSEENIESRVGQITDGNGTRIIFDPIAGEILNTLASAAAYGGIIIEYGALSDKPTPFPLFPVIAKGLTIRGYWLTELTSDPQWFDRAKHFVLDHLQDGSFRPLIDKVFPFAQVVEAYRYLESTSHTGKVMLRVVSDGYAG